MVELSKPARPNGRRPKLFKRDSYLKLTDTNGDFRFGYIAETRERGSVLVIDLFEEGRSKIEWDNEYAKNTGRNLLVKDFSNLLTEIEKKMVLLLAQEKSTKEIGEAMHISPVTVRAHIRDLKLKLQVDTREQLFAYSQGIVTKL